MVATYGEAISSYGGGYENQDSRVYCEGEFDFRSYYSELYWDAWGKSHEQIDGSPLNWTPFIKCDFQQFIGGGGFGDVFLGLWCPRRHLCPAPQIVVKRFRGCVINDPKAKKQIQREISVCSRLRHENIVPFVGLCYDASGFPMLISERLLNGTVKHYLKRNGSACLLAIVLGILRGLLYLHRHDIVHGDLKADNVLVNLRGQPCLCDFGLSRVLSNSDLWDTNASHAKGTLRWQAPELMLGNQVTPTKESDMYAFGMTSYEIYTDQTPFPSCKTSAAIIIAAKDREFKMERPNNMPWLNDNTWYTMNLCWLWEPCDRPSAESLLCRHVCWDPADRYLCAFRAYQPTSTRGWSQYTDSS